MDDHNHSMFIVDLSPCTTYLIVFLKITKGGCHNIAYLESVTFCTASWRFTIIVTFYSTLKTSILLLVPFHLLKGEANGPFKKLLGSLLLVFGLNI